MGIEYERSFKVASVKPYIEYCEENGFVLEEIVEQNRVVFENKFSNNIIARITTETKDGVAVTVFDCKNVGKRESNLKVSSESIPLVVTNENKEKIFSILETLDFFEAANNLRKRYVYSKGNVKFEIDEYIRPQTNVIAIEGEQNLVEDIYAQLCILENCVE